MGLQVIDTFLTQQVFITGRVTDAVSGRQLLSPPVVSLVYQTAPGRAYPLAQRLTPDGLYAFFGMPEAAFPSLSAGDTLDLSLVVAANRYQTRSEPLSFTAADLALTLDNRHIAGQDVEVPLRASLPLTRDIALLPIPVHLAGRIVDSSDPAVVLGGAEVQVTAPSSRGPVSTDLQGFFTLPDMPVAPEVTVQVTLTGFDMLEEVVALDYRQPVNRRMFALDSS